jgi:hypothetical protein
MSITKSFKNVDQNYLETLKSKFYHSYMRYQLNQPRLLQTVRKLVLFYIQFCQFCRNDLDL